MYFYHYYGSWGGWERGAPARAHELWLLKKLTNRYAWAGSSVHETIAWALSRRESDGILPDLDESVLRMRTRMRSEFTESRSGAWKVRRALGLVEHAYDEPVSDEDWRENWEHAKRCLTAFYEAKVRREILEAPKGSWFPIDSLDSFELQNLKIYVAPDFAFTDSSGQLRIIDWKTGIAKESDERQVQGYALFARAKWNASMNDIVAELHYLSIPEVAQVEVSEDALEAFRREVMASVSEMKSRLLDPEENLAREEDFEPTENKNLCRRCAFRMACDSYQERR